MIDLDTDVKKALSSTDKIPSVPQVYIPGEGRRPMVDYNEINVLELDDVKQAKLESWIAKAIGTELMNHYPGRQWGVHVDTEGQMIMVMCPSVSHEKGYYISMVGRCLNDLVIKARHAAGEILERYNLSRDRKFDSDILETLARDAKDEVISPDAAPEPIHKAVIT